MKFVEDASLGLLSALLSSQNGSIRCSARLERYAARLTGRSKAAAKRLDAKILRDLELEPSSPELTCSALGDMHNVSSRRLLISLISALNATAPELSFEYVLHALLLKQLVIVFFSQRFTTYIFFPC
jgi:hypothetical protein